MGAALGLVLGIGLLLIWQSFGPPRPARVRSRPSARERLQDMLAQAGIEVVSPGALVACCVSVGVIVLLGMLAVSRSLPIAVCFGLICGYAPIGLVRMRQRHRRVELREVWPEVVDNLTSGVRAGLSLPEALTQIGSRGPEQVRPAFQRFGRDYGATGSFYDCLDRLKAALADPVSDRIMESLRLARDVGGSDLGTLLRALSAFLREDARTRAELETRQGWTVNAARLAVSAPWIVLLMLSTKPEAVAQYNTPAGVVVLGVGGAVCLLAYRLMLRIGRLPDEPRVLR